MGLDVEIFYEVQNFHMILSLNILLSPLSQGKNASPENR